MLPPNDATAGAWDEPALATRACVDHSASDWPGPPAGGATSEDGAAWVNQRFWSSPVPRQTMANLFPALTRAGPNCDPGRPTSTVPALPLPTFTHAFSCCGSQMTTGAGAVDLGVGPRGCDRPVRADPEGVERPHSNRACGKCDCVYTFNWLQVENRLGQHWPISQGHDARGGVQQPEL